MKAKILAALFAAGMLTPALAQEDDGGDIIQYYFVEVKSGHGTEFNAGWDAFWACYRDNDGQWEWSAWNPAAGKLGGVMFRSMGHQWADFDAEDPAGKACDEAFETSLAPHFGDVYSGFERYLADMSRPTDDPVNVVMTYQFDFSNIEAAREVIAAWHEAFVDADWGAYVWLENVAGGGKWDMTVAILEENFAGFAPSDPGFDEVQEAYHGKRKADSLDRKWREAVKSVRRGMWRRNEELSYSPE
ncbi:MAG: hypothetical protein ACE5FO_13360 [Parvularculaceae bacterium]